MSVYLGADLGTSGLKLVAVDDAGGFVGQAEESYPVDSLHQGWAETCPQVWVRALRSALGSIAGAFEGRRVAGIGVDGQMHGLVLCDARGAPCRPAILWPDRRAQSSLARWRSLPVPLRARLANPLVAGMTGPVLGWLHEHEPEVLQRASTALLPKDFLRQQLAPGPPVTDRSDASATLLWDVTADDWATDVVEALDLPQRLLAQVVASGTVVGVTHWLAEHGHRDDVPVVAGSADAPAALLAAGGLAPGEVQVNLGTGAQILRGVAAPEPVANPVTHLYADAENGWYAMAAVQNAGLALARVRTMLGLSWDEVFTAAGASAPGSGGVSFLPFLTGERGAIAGPASRGAWLGIDDRTSREDLARAAIEAMAFCVRRALSLLGADPTSVRLSGGGARHPLVSASLADLLGAEIHLLTTRSASAIGAAMLAADGRGTTLPVSLQEVQTVEPGRSPALLAAYELWLERLHRST